MALFKAFNDSIETGNEDTLLAVVKDMLVLNIFEQIENNNFGGREPYECNIGIIFPPRDFKEYLKPAVFYAFQRLCNDDNLQEKYHGLPRKVLEEIFIELTGYTPIYRNFDEIESKSYPLIKMLRDFCVEKLNVESDELITMLTKMDRPYTNGVINSIHKEQNNDLFIHIDRWLDKHCPINTIKSANKK